MIVFTGDWHGEYDQAYRKMKDYDLRDCTVVQVGDFGIGFQRHNKDMRKLVVLNEQLANRNIMLYAFRGNHDDPAYFDGTVELSNIRLLADYSVIEVEGKNILCVGGAISIDRKPNPDVRDYRGVRWKGRSEGTNYWASEEFVLKDVDLSGIDIVATHSAPDFCTPHTKYGMEKWIMYDPDLVADVNKEREGLTKLYDMLSKNNRITHWFYGHFHNSNTDETDITKFVLLNILEFYEI